MGRDESKPELILFSGAKSRAYVQLYQPIMSYKDEVKLRLGGKKIFLDKPKPKPKIEPNLLDIKPIIEKRFVKKIE